MATFDELDKFISKFKSLWNSGSNAKLVVDVEAGVAQISLSVNVALNNATGLATGISCGHGSHRKGGGDSPCRKRRRARREALRKAKVAAEEAAVKETGATELKEAEKVDSDAINTAKLVTEKAEMSLAQFEVIVEAQEEVTNFEVTEAIEVNFEGGLDDQKVGKKDQLRTIYVHKMLNEKEQNGDIEGQKIRLYSVYVRHDDRILNLFNSWTKQGYFDDLAFQNSKMGIRQVKIREIRKIV